MAPILLFRNEINDDRWNTAIGCSRQRVVYAFSWYLDIVCEDWVAIVWPSSVDYQIILPLPIKRKYGINVVQQPLFCQYLGFFYQNEFNEKVASDFLRLAVSRFKYISTYYFNPHNTDLIREILTRSGKFSVSTFFTNWLSLAQSHESIYRSYNADRKANLKWGVKRKWTVVQSDDISRLIDLFRENHESRIPGGVAPEAYNVLRELSQTPELHGRSDIFYAIEGEECKAGIWIVRNDNCAIYLFNAANEDGRKGNARTFLLDQYFRANAGADLMFDFEAPNEASVESFYESFGAVTKSFLSIHRNGLPFPLNVIQRWRRNYARLGIKTRQFLF